MLKNGQFASAQDFFGKPAYLTVSGQLNAEVFATALSDVSDKLLHVQLLTLSCARCWIDCFDVQPCKNTWPQGGALWLRNLDV